MCAYDVYKWVIILREYMPVKTLSLDHVNSFLKIDFIFLSKNLLISTYTSDNEPKNRTVFCPLEYDIPSIDSCAFHTISIIFISRLFWYLSIAWRYPLHLSPRVTPSQLLHFEERKLICFISRHMHSVHFIALSIQSGIIVNYFDREFHMCESLINTVAFLKVILFWHFFIQVAF